MRPILVCCFFITVASFPAFAQQAVEQKTTVLKNAASATQSDAEIKKEKKVSLEAIYKREFAFLQEQKKELEKRLRSFKSQAANAEKSIQRKIDTLERKNIELSAQDDGLRTSLSAAEHKDDVVNDNNELLEMTYSQANASLDSYGLSLEGNSEFSDADDNAKLTMLFGNATQLLQDLGKVSTRQEPFFLTDGTEVKGNVIHVGNIAAYGVSDQASGILVPAGAGRLKLWPEPADDIAKTMLNGNPPDELKIFLYESKEKAVSEKQEKTIYSIIESGGIIGWVIVCLGCVALILIGIRWAMLYLASLNTRSIAEAVIPFLLKNQEKEALDYCREQKGPFARVLTATIQNSHGNRDHMDDVISEALLHESGSLNKFGSTILVIASISPLLGLLGTVTGMISTFDIITEFGTGDPKLLSSGISVALVTTELGLIVAIPTVLCGTLLTSWSDSIKYNLEEIALKATNILLDRDHPDRPDGVDDQKDAVRTQQPKLAVN